MKSNQACFTIGQIINHKHLSYRGVIFDVDPDFQGSEDWYNTHAAKAAYPPKNEPWYHVLIDDDAHIAYIAQRNMTPDETHVPVDHPLLEDFFDSFDGESYHMRHTVN